MNCIPADTSCNALKPNHTAVLHTSQLLSPYDPFLLKVIDSAIWIAANSQGINLVKVYLHPTRNNTNLFADALLYGSKIRSLIRILLCNPPLFISKCFHKVKRVLSIQISRKHAPLSPPSAEVYNAISEKVYYGKESVNIEINGITILLSQSEISSSLRSRDIFFVHISFLRSLVKTIIVSFPSSIQRLLSFKLDGVLIGDLAASSALRLCPSCRGSLRGKWLEMLEQLINAAIFINYIRNFLRTQDPLVNKNHIAMVREPAYLDGCYLRFLGMHGAQILNTNCPIKLYELHQIGNDLYSDFKVSPSSIRLTSSQIRSSIDYLDERVESPASKLSYMSGQLPVQNQLLDIDGEPLYLHNSDRVAVLFLHSFDDAQFIFGPDGFLDLYDWTIWTLDKLINNPQYTRILIKPHPNVNYYSSEYPGDKAAVDRLLRNYPATNKVSWLHSTCGPLSFWRLSCKLIAITHHGSIAEELTHLDVPVISSICSPWSAHYKFVFSWEDPQQYLEMLSSPPESFVVSRLHKSELYRYVFVSRIQNHVDHNERWPWYCLFGLNDPGVTFFKTLAIAASRLSLITPKDSVLVSFFAQQFSRYSNLR